jgi:hypothetical protein
MLFNGTFYYLPLILQFGGAVVALIVCKLNLQLPMQSVSIPLILRVRTLLRRSAQHYVIKFLILPRYLLFSGLVGLVYAV